MIKKYVLIFLAGLLSAPLVAVADGPGGSGGSGGSYKRGPGVKPVENKHYLEECGSCHFAYQPGLLPRRSWEKVMGRLDAHFGDNAELDAEALAELTAYVMDNAADQALEKRSVKIMRSLESDEAPLRITETPYIHHQHDEIPARYIKHAEIGTLSNCTACHKKAREGYYGERWIEIPGVGPWED